ncbi:putative Chitin elicitor-binding protein [Cocos nucifera]|uniref:Putative Chitin elicitor-binding protein n=1 Tax=Cocos nucifera TaxID=13894 RepID=A0A8K0N4Q4_COCNU|nr:putative Chitin elicitor-binding protein [Cocos nucifera]
MPSPTLLSSPFSRSTPLSTHSIAVHANSICVRFSCSCSNGISVSTYNHPIYKVKTGDSLGTITYNIFNEFITYEDIAMVNKILDPNKIEVGQKLWILLPCSCNLVDGAVVVHYAHVVVVRSSMKGIIVEFGMNVDEGDQERSRRQLRALVRWS